MQLLLKHSSGSSPSLATGKEVAEVSSCMPLGQERKNKDSAAGKGHLCPELVPASQGEGEFWRWSDLQENLSSGFSSATLRGVSALLSALSFEHMS